MKFLQRIGTAFNVQHGEAKLVLLFLGHAFFIGTTMAFIRTASYTLFLEKFDAKTLPFVYIIVALVGTLITTIYLRLERRLSFEQLTKAILAFIFVGLLSIRLAFFVTDSDWLTFVLPVWNELLLCFINIEYGLLTVQAFDVRQGKRLFGLIDSGQFMALVTIGPSIGILGRSLGTVNLISLAAVASALTLVVLSYLLSMISKTKASGKSSREVKKDQNDKTVRLSLREMLKNRYVLLMFANYILFLFAFYFVHNAFYAEVRSQKYMEVAAFLGHFEGIYGLLSLIAMTFLSNMVLNRYGLMAGLLALPLGLVAGSILVTATGAFYGPHISLIFWFSVVTQLIRLVFNNAFNRPSRTILFQVLPTEQRSWAQATVYGIIDPMFSGVIGGTLLVLIRFFSFGTVELFKALLIILVLWITVILLTRKEYMAMLSQTLSKRRAGDLSFNLQDGSSLSIIKKGLDSPYAAEVIYCLNLLQEIEDEDLENVLIRLMQHPVSEVRQEALRKIEQLGLVSALEAVQNRFEIEESPQIRAEALRTLASLGETDMTQVVARYLSDPEPKVKLGAMVGLLRSGGIEGVLLAGEELIALVDSEKPQDRVFAAQVFGQTGISTFYRPLLKLLRDQSPQVRRAALEASGKLKNPHLSRPIIENLKATEARSLASSALIAMSESALPELESTFNHGEHDSEVQSQIAYVLGRIRGEKATSILKNKLRHPDEEVHCAILNALVSCAYQAEEKDTETVQKAIESEVEDAVWILACLADIDRCDPTSVLTRALNHKLDKKREKILSLLSFIHPPQPILRAKAHLTRDSVKERAYALELIDNTISRDLRDLIFPLLERLNLEDCLKALSSRFPHECRASSERLYEIINGNGNRITPWLQCCALYVAGKEANQELSPFIVPKLTSHDPLIRESAVWTLGQMNSVCPKDQLQPLLHDRCKYVSQMARYVLEGEKLVLSTIEKVLILKTVSIFSEIPDDELAELVCRLQEVEVKRDDPIIEMGDIGTSMYVVVSGKVRVHVGDHEITTLGERAVFGELAALDPEPRSASITAVENSLLFVLDQDTLYELMAEQANVARGIIRVLCQRVRSSVRQTYLEA